MAQFGLSTQLIHQRVHGSAPGITAVMFPASLFLLAVAIRDMPNRHD